jgi:abortive infection bacteriophage resistance protein
MSSQAPQERPSYAKPWLSYKGQLAQLIDRGLTVADAAAAEKFLSHVNYYRFSGFCLAFESHRRAFLANVTFEDLKAAYEFDVRLRDLLNEGLEVIEIDIRTCLAHHIGQRHGAFGHVNPNNFFERFDHGEWMEHIHEEVDRSSEPFVEHFRNTYAEYPDLPIWMLTEIMSFGTLTRMYRGMNKHDQRVISNRYRLQPLDFGTFLLHLAYVRNLCAHHLRLWDCVWSVKPSLPKGKYWDPPLLPTNDRLFSTVVLTYHLLVNCPAIGTFATDWRDRLRGLLSNPPNTPNALTNMGMPKNWQDHPMWS